MARAGKISERIARLKQQILEYNELKNKINDIQFFLKEEEFFKDVEIQKELEKEFVFVKRNSRMGNAQTSFW